MDKLTKVLSKRLSNDNESNNAPFGLKNAPSEFQKVMNDIFNAYTTFIIVYIDDVLIFSENIEQHFKHLNIFINVVKNTGLVVSARKIKLFQTEIRFLGHIIKDLELLLDSLSLLRIIIRFIIIT